MQRGMMNNRTDLPVGRLGDDRFVLQKVAAPTSSGSMR
jgi:hypothetical protein